MTRARPALLAPAALAAALLAVSPARADEAARPAPSAPAAEPARPALRPADGSPKEPARAGTAGRLRATHRVDVIAPGERVESVIDRMRAERAPAAREVAPPQLRGMERGAVRPPGEAAPAAGAPMGAHPGQPPPRGEGPPPDRRPR